MLYDFYPNVINEFETMREVLSGKSIARAGDGELAHMAGRKNISQEFDPKLQKELIEIFKAGSNDKCLVGIPPLNDKRLLKADYWLKGSRVLNYSKYFNINKKYHSSFITRPDNIKGLYTREYYDMIKALWANQDILLVGSFDKSLCPEIMPEAKSIETIKVNRRDAYKDIDDIEKAIGNTEKRVLLCIGPTATVLAWRLSKKGIHTIDCGHIGMFISHFEEVLKDK